MLNYLIKKRRFVPDQYKNSIYDIDFKALYDKGYRLILSDLDNTIVSYDTPLPDDKSFEFKKMLDEYGFELIVVSNSHKKRVKKFCDAFGVKYQSFCTKPLKRGIKKAIKKASRKYNPNEIVLIGDQLMTDIFTGKRCGLYGILVKPIKRKTEVFTTKINRKIEKLVLKRTKKKFVELYDSCLKQYEEENHGKN